ncbi:DUF2490 domain-containing protein [Prosthecobacter vanneervenii]|uniref:DUF2490 domain-containing protein n=1 Tax=Prosthecobacter vanneervenii TaxID=48466 RepID=A0A7W7Y7K3_9BACT|nr:DUF2490 domain-containing protein [Prosthecobacter vanneervenii]MBB5031087.1 hypothetical protein [Prosthecobacter vanneervenii]
MPRLLLILVLLLLQAQLLHADEWWAWTNVDYYRKPPWTGSVFMANFADEVDGSYAQMVSPRVKYAAARWLDLGLGLSMLRLENIATGDRYDQLRPELEVDPHYELTQQLRVDWRNRMEWRENQGAPSAANRTRHRVQVAWTLPQPLGPLTRVFASDECLMDLHLRRQTENRLVPLGLTFKITGSMDLDIFYMIDSKRTKTTWKHESVLGTYLRVRF